MRMVEEIELCMRLTNQDMSDSGARVEIMRQLLKGYSVERVTEKINAKGKLNEISF